MDISTKRSASPNAGEFFLETLEDLREKVSKRLPRKYQFALIGLLLRKLLLDNHNLVDTVNLKREKVFYWIPVRKGSPDKGYNWSAQATIVLFDFLFSTKPATPQGSRQSQPRSTNPTLDVPPAIISLLQR
jgi:hypothetical protein